VIEQCLGELAVAVDHQVPVPLLTSRTAATGSPPMIVVLVQSASRVCRHYLKIFNCGVTN